MSEAVDQRDGGRSAKHALSFAGVVLLAASALLGGNLRGVRDRLLGSGVPSPKPAALSPFVPVGPNVSGQRTVLRSEPWWQARTRLEGTGSGMRSFVIRGGVIQWRIGWSCRRGRLVVGVAGHPAPLIDATCPASGIAPGTRSGAIKLRIDSAGSWRLALDQQVDVPLIEPPLAAMSAPGSVTVARGVFERIDQYATGRVAIYRLASGRYALRFTGFYVTPNVDLDVRLSPLRSPRTTRQYLSAPSVHVAPLMVTAGSLNFIVPDGIDPTAYRSVVIWCPLITSAYAEAPLRAVS